MTEILSVPMKKGNDVDITKPLKNLIATTYSTADKPEDFTDAISDLQKLRNAATKNPDRSEASLDTMMCYYDQLVSLEMKIPANEVQVPFKWKNAFDKGSIFGGRISLTVPNLGYEKVRNNRWLLYLCKHDSHFTFLTGLHTFQHRSHVHYDRGVTEL